MVIQKKNKENESCERSNTMQCKLSYVAFFCQNTPTDGLQNKAGDSVLIIIRVVNF